VARNVTAFFSAAQPCDERSGCTWAEDAAALEGLDVPSLSLRRRLAYELGLGDGRSAGVLVDNGRKGWRRTAAADGELFRRAKFALCPRGTVPWVPSPTLAVCAGAVPAILEHTTADELALPLSRSFDWSSFALRVSADAIPRLESMFSSVAPNALHRLQLAAQPLRTALHDEDAIVRLALTETEALLAPKRRPEAAHAASRTETPPVVVATGCSSDVWPGLAALLNSVRIDANDLQAVVHVFSRRGEAPPPLAAWQQTDGSAGNATVRIELHTFDESDWAHEPAIRTLGAHRGGYMLSPYNWIKFHLDLYLPRNGTVLWLDCDTLVLGGVLAAVTQTKLKTPIAAPYTPQYLSAFLCAEANAHLNAVHGVLAINAGVLYIGLAFDWRALRQRWEALAAVHNATCIWSLSSQPELQVLFRVQPLSRAKVVGFLGAPTALARYSGAQIFSSLEYFERQALKLWNSSAEGQLSNGRAFSFHQTHFKRTILHWNGESKPWNGGSPAVRLLWAEEKGALLAALWRTFLPRGYPPVQEAWSPANAQKKTVPEPAQSLATRALLMRPPIRQEDENAVQVCEIAHAAGFSSQLRDAPNFHLRTDSSRALTKERALAFASWLSGFGLRVLAQESAGVVWITSLLQARRYLEWGGGASTVLAAAWALQDGVASRQATVIESSKSFLSFLRKRAPVVQRAKEASRLTLRVPSLSSSSYAGAVGPSDCCFDLVLVDGWSRGRCLLSALRVVHARSTVLVHDLPPKASGDAGPEFLRRKELWAVADRHYTLLRHAGTMAILRPKVKRVRDEAHLQPLAGGASSWSADRAAARSAAQAEKRKKEDRQVRKAAREKAKIAKKKARQEELHKKRLRHEKAKGGTEAQK
jgi:hypothetical protein